MHDGHDSLSPSELAAVCGGDSSPGNWIGAGVGGAAGAAYGHFMAKGIHEATVGPYALRQLPLRRNPMYFPFVALTTGVLGAIGWSVGGP